MLAEASEIYGGRFMSITLGDLVNTQGSLNKLFGTNRIDDWKLVLELADFENIVRDELERYGKAYNAIQRDMQRRAEERSPQVDAQGNEIYPLTPDEQEDREKQVAELQLQKSKISEVPYLGEKLLRTLYNGFDKEKMEAAERFTGHDIAAFKKVGLLDVREEPKKE
jgi:hypothetical protein